MILRNFELISREEDGSMVAEVGVRNWRTLWLVERRARIFKQHRSEPWFFVCGEQIPGSACTTPFRKWYAREEARLGGCPVIAAKPSKGASDEDLE